MERLSLEYDKNMVPTAEHFEDYLIRAYDKYSILNTLVLRNRIKKLKEIYVPLTLECEDNAGGTDQLKINGYPKDFMTKNRKVLITDTAGMGKSTIVKRMFLDVIDKGYGIPIFIELRRINENHDLVTEIESQVSSLSQKFNHQLLVELLMSGGFIFFFDGCDEIPIIDRAFAIHEIENFISKANANTFVVTSRPDEVINCFGSFKRVYIRGLEKEESYQLLRNYDNNGPVSLSLIKTLKDKRYKMITEFMENPLLVSLLFIAFDYKPIISINKHSFYRQVFDALFESHDLSKGDNYSHEKRSKLNSDDFEKILRRVGYECQKRQQVEFLKTDILNIIDKAKSSYMNFTFANSDFLKDLLTSVPLFCKDGIYYKWAHKSLQEYYAARFISVHAKNSQEKILQAIYNSSNIQRYINLLDLYYDMDPTGFSRCISIPLLKEFVSFYNRMNLTKYNVIPKNLVDVRLGYIFGHTMLIGDQRKDNYLFAEDFGEHFKEKYNIKVDCITLFHPMYYVADSYRNQGYILDLVRNKIPELFTTYRGKCDKDLVIDKDFFIDGVKTFSNSTKDFEKVNIYMSHACRNGYLDINKVKPYLKSLKETLSNGFNSDDLCDGL